MKIILTGSTGFIGTEVLTQCISNPNITSIIALTRRPLPSTHPTSPKIQTVIVEDFTTYSTPTIAALSGAEACIWSLGKASIPTDEEARRISIEYTLAAAEAFNQISKQLGNGKRFRFVKLSGMICERDQEKKLWYLQTHRRIAGQAETELLLFAEKNSASFEGYVIRPSMVLSKERSYFNWFMGMIMPTAAVEKLAGAMVDIALNGSERVTWENGDIGNFGS